MNDKLERVVLVDDKNRPIGTEEKLKAHELGKLHRAFSIFVFSPDYELLLQQRAAGKYHCPSLWSNTVCSHPREGETYSQAVHRKLKQEMNIDCRLERVFSFIYKENVGKGLIEHEYDTIFFGEYEKNKTINPNSEEVQDYKWISLDNLKKDIVENSNKYTPWFKIALNKIEDLKLFPE